jgi:hypothetical protein
VESLVLAEKNFGRNVPYSPTHGRHDYPGEHGHGFGACDHENRSAFVLGFGPPDLASGWKCYHGSSSTSARVAS